VLQRTLDNAIGNHCRSREDSNLVFKFVLGGAIFG